MADAQPVCRVGDNTLDTGTIPIVFVPGLMGTRLRFPDIDRSWDPDAKLAMIHWIRADAEVVRGQLAVDNPAEVMTTGGSFTDAERARGWAGVAWGIYGRFVRDLGRQRFGAYATPVYAIGYDWRQSNRISGAAVSRRITEILEAEGSDRFILASHSMGGLVTRACLKDNVGGVADKCLGVVHIAQPVHGAPVLVRRMFTGAVLRHDGGYNLRTVAFTNILGNTRARAITTAASMSGPLQLLVTPRYRHDFGPWYTYRAFEASASDEREWDGASWDLYARQQSPPGLIPPDGEPYSVTGVVRREFGRNLRRARQFHDWLGVWKHGETWAIYGTGLAGDTRVRFELPPERVESRWIALPGAPAVVVHWAKGPGGEEVVVRDPDPADRGVVVEQARTTDGTVPVASAQGLFPGEDHRVTGDVDYGARRQFEVTGAGAIHDAICHHREVEACVFGIVRHLLAG